MTGRHANFTAILCFALIFFGALQVGAQPVTSKQDESVQINLKVIDRFAPPIVTVKGDDGKVRQRPAVPAPPVKQRMYPDGTKKSEYFTNYEASLVDLRKKYFPEEYEQSLKNQAQQRHVTKRRSIPAPAVKPDSPAYARKSSLAQANRSKKTKSPTPVTSPEEILSATQPANPQPLSGDGEASNPAGDKLVSIAYVDAEIDLNANVQSALKQSYIAKINANRNSRIGLYSYSSPEGKSTKEANRLALERAISLKDFLVRNGVNGGRIDIYPRIKSQSSSFSDWIDIMVQ